jgi:metal-responsive CopG/Arc/MetJ family transcriptional regulator
MCAEPTKRGRRTGGRYAPTSISLSSELRKRVDAWAAKQSDKPARSEAILRLVELGLEATQQKGSLANRAAKASEMLGWL